MIGDACKGHHHRKLPLRLVLAPLEEGTHICTYFWDELEQVLGLQEMNISLGYHSEEAGATTFLPSSLEIKLRA